MSISHILALFEDDQRKAIEYPGLKRKVLPFVVRHFDTTPFNEGMITYSQLTAENADTIIREQIAYFEAAGQGFEWKLYGYDQPPDLKDRLIAHGFEVEEVESVVVLDLKEAPAMLWQPIQADVRLITDPAHLADVIYIEEQVWNGDFSSLGAMLTDLMLNHPKHISIYVAYVDNQPACSAWIFFGTDSQFASLLGGSTISTYRKRGLYTALLSIRAQEANRRGVRFLTVDASAMSRPILERFGFQYLTDTYPCRWTHPSAVDSVNDLSD